MVTSVGAGPASAGARVEKLMSITRAELEAGLQRFNRGQQVASTGNAYICPAMPLGTVTVTFEELPGVTLGGLMKLPRARITIDLSAIEASRRGEALGFFDRTFQRGGG